MADTEYFIELIRARPCLYDKSNPDYKDVRGVRLNNYTDICNAMVEAGFSNYDSEYDY